MTSFLNLIDITTGRQIRLAEFGFEAKKPSFDMDKITFVRDSSLWSFDISTGMIKKIGNLPDSSATTDGSVKISFISDKHNGVGHCELIVNGKVIARFMGSEHSLGARPEKDGKVVFVGYPSEDGIN